MSVLTEYMFATRPAVVKLQLIEISHPGFTSIYRLTRSSTVGVTVTHEGGGGPYVYRYMPMEIKTMGSAGNLSQDLEITFGDLGSILPLQMTIVNEANKRTIKPTVVYREYVSYDLTEPMFGPFTFQINSIAFNKTGAVFTAKPVLLNTGRTGEVYDVGRFPMLGAFV